MVHRTRIWPEAGEYDGCMPAGHLPTRKHRLASAARSSHRPTKKQKLAAGSGLATAGVSPAADSEAHAEPSHEAVNKLAGPVNPEFQPASGSPAGASGMAAGMLPSTSDCEVQAGSELHSEQLDAASSKADPACAPTAGPVPGAWRQPKGAAKKPAAIAVGKSAPRTAFSLAPGKPLEDTKPVRHSRQRLMRREGRSMRSAVPGGMPWEGAPFEQGAASSVPALGARGRAGQGYRNVRAKVDTGRTKSKVRMPTPAENHIDQMREQAAAGTAIGMDPAQAAVRDKPKSRQPLKKGITGVEAPADCRAGEAQSTDQAGRHTAGQAADEPQAPGGAASPQIPEPAKEPRDCNLDAKRMTSTPASAAGRSCEPGRSELHLGPLRVTGAALQRHPPLEVTAWQGRCSDAHLDFK